MTLCIFVDGVHEKCGVVCRERSKNVDFGWTIPRLIELIKVIFQAIPNLSRYVLFLVILAGKPALGERMRWVL